MKILLASHTPIGGDIVVGSHHLARVFAETGHEVLHLVTPVTPFHMVLVRRREVRHRLVAAIRGCRAHRPGLRQLVPLSLVPGSLARFIPTGGDPVTTLTLPSLRRRLERLEFDRVDLLLVDDPWLHGVSELVEATKRIYRPTDLYRFTTGSRAVDLESSILARSDGIVATSAPVLDHALAVAGRPLPAIVVENGVDLAHVERERPPPAEYASVPAPRLVYVGALDDRFDWGAVERAASDLPRMHFVLIGPPGARGRTRRTPSNVHVLGARPYARLPAYLQHADVGILPLGDHPANRGRSPMKLYEYLAAGLPVVARATPELERRDVPHVHLYRTREGLGQALDRVLAAPPDGADCHRAAAGHDWRGIASRILDFAELLPSTASRAVASGVSRAHRP